MGREKELSINIREAMSTMVTMEDNIDAITKEIYNHAAEKLGTKSRTHSKRLFSKEINCIKAVKHSAIRASRLIIKRKHRKVSLSPKVIHITRVKNYIAIINKLVD